MQPNVQYTQCRKTKGSNMGTAKEFIERVQSDTAFVEKVNKQILALGEAGETDIFAAVCKVAGTEGYEITLDQIKEMSTRQNGELTEEELEKVAGGSMATTLELLTVYATGALIVVSVTLTVQS